MQTLQNNTSLQNGKYFIKKVLGQGGFGITYLAENTLLNRNVAIKEFFIKDLCNRESDESTLVLGDSGATISLITRFKEKFIKEAITISQLDHPNIIKVYDVFEENYTAYYVMEYVEGETLADIISSRGALPEKEAVAYIKDVALAVSYIHDRHINHFDIKPANIMIREGDNHVFLLDFGISKHYDAITGNQTSTMPIGVSHGYAPIEQYSPITTFSPQSDVYSLGATLYKLLTGNTPKNAGKQQDPLPSHISQNVRNAVTNAMKTMESDRLQSVRSFITMLDNSKTSAFPGAIVVIVIIMAILFIAYFVGTPNSGSLVETDSPSSATGNSTNTTNTNNISTVDSSPSPTLPVTPKIKIRYKINTDESDMKQLTAIIDGKTYDIGDNFDLSEITDIFDYNNDGIDEVIYWQQGGQMPAEYFYVEYKGDGYFRIKSFGESYHEAVIEQWEGQRSIVLKNPTMDSAEKTRYVYRNHSMEIADVMKKSNLHSIGTLHMEQFPEDSDWDDEISMRYDLDGDGLIDEICGCYNARWGTMCVLVRFGNGMRYKGSNYYNRIGILQSKTNGVHDLVVSESVVLRWNGSKYYDPND